MKEIEYCSNRTFMELKYIKVTDFLKCIRFQSDLYGIEIISKLFGYFEYFVPIGPLWN